MKTFKEILEEKIKNIKVGDILQYSEKGPNRMTRGWKAEVIDIKNDKITIQYMVKPKPDPIVIDSSPKLDNKYFSKV